MLEGLPPVMWFIRRNMRRHRTAGISVPQFRALCLLDSHPTASLSLVAEHLGSSTPSASRLISGLVARALVTRKESAEDRRQLLLTPRGRSVLAKAREATAEHIAREIESLTPQQRQDIYDAMQVMQAIFAHKSTCCGGAKFIESAADDDVEDEVEHAVMLKGKP